MTKITQVQDIDLAGNIQAACENNPDVRFRSNYSGRRMYGGTCVGIVGSAEACRAALADVIVDCQFYADLFPEVVKTLLDYSEDSMGMEVILYWPDIQCQEEEEADADLDDFQDAFDQVDAGDPLDIEYDR